MGKHTGNNGAAYIGGHDLSPDLSAVDMGQTVDTLDSTGMGATAKSYLAGLKDGTVSWKGFYDDATPDGLDSVFNGLVGTPSVSTFLPSGDTAGLPAYCGQAEVAKTYKISAPVAGIVTASADFVCSGGLDRAVVVQAKAVVTGTGSTQDGAAQDNGVLTSNGGRAYFHLLAVDNAATVTLKLQHSVDNVTFVDLATSAITGSTPAGDSQLVAAGATVNRYLRRRVTTTNAKNATLQASFARY